MIGAYDGFIPPKEDVRIACTKASGWFGSPAHHRARDLPAECVLHFNCRTRLRNKLLLLMCVCVCVLLLLQQSLLFYFR